MKKLIFLFALCSLNSVMACSSTVGGKDSKPKTKVFAMDLRGLEKAVVTEKMGSAPAETRKSPDVAYYFLSEENENHPAPQLVRYRFTFEKGVLVSVDPEHEKH